MDSENMYVVKTGAIAAFLDSLGVSGNLHGPAVNLLAILNGLEKKFTSTNTASVEICSNSPCQYCIHIDRECTDCFDCNHFEGRKLHT